MIYPQLTPDDLDTIGDHRQHGPFCERRGRLWCACGDDITPPRLTPIPWAGLIFYGLLIGLIVGVATTAFAGWWRGTIIAVGVAFIVAWTGGTAYAEGLHKGRGDA